MNIHIKFIKRLINELGYKDVTFEEIQYGGEEYICTLGTNNKLPSELSITNLEIISYLSK